MNIELTPTQANDLLACLDASIKAGGVRTAVVAMPLVAVIHNSSEEDAKDQTPPVVDGRVDHGEI